MRKKLVVGNWKMNGSLADNEQLLAALLTNLSEFSEADVGVCVPFPYLFQVKQILEDNNIAWGAQNLSHKVNGAYTGEVSVTMLKDFACKYVLVGHSERRTLYDETDSLVTEKFVIAQSMGIVPILCIGETLTERQDNLTEQVIARQLDAVLNSVGIEAFRNAVIAYEPVWAIGTGQTATPDQAQAVHAFIRNRLHRHDESLAAQIRILYGGSVKAGNAAELCSLPDVDGGLVGGASLNAKEFSDICRNAVSKLN